MNHFRKYDHLERLGHRNTRNIELGLVHVFPKLDGTNASVWWDGEEVQCGSRNRVLTAEADNAGFHAWVHGEDPKALWLRQLVTACTDIVIYGEWMVPHTLKTYRLGTWRRFWIFDVYDRDRGTYMAWEEYNHMLTDAEDPAQKLDLIEPLCTIQDPSEDQMRAQVETNTYLIQDGAGLGEGVVLKNYPWRTPGAPWAKVVRNCFKEENARAFGIAEKHGEKQVEVEIAAEFVTPHLVGKTRAKVLLDIANELNVDTSETNWQQSVQENHRNRVIPQLLGRVYHDLIEEEMWTILKKHKGCTIDFKKLNQRTVLATKALAEDLF